jgi:hypothetical protein
MAALDNASQGMANLLRTYCQRQGKECRFQEERYETHCGILWGIKCFVDGRQVGEATRSGRRGAKNVAAWEGCKAFGLIQVGGIDLNTPYSHALPVHAKLTRQGPDTGVMKPNGDNSHGNDTESAGRAAHLASSSLAKGDAPSAIESHDAARNVPTADTGDMISTSGDDQGAMHAIGSHFGSSLDHHHVPRLYDDTTQMTISNDIMHI